MKLRCLVYCALVPCIAIAQRFDPINNQNLFLQDVNGNPMMLRSNYEIDGTPYYSENYCRANIKIARGKSYTGIELKLNLENNRIIYKTPDGKEMEAIAPVERIEFLSCATTSNTEIFRAGFSSIDNQSQSNYYQVLDSGKVQLLKYRKVSFMDQKPYGSANTIRKYDVAVRYYAYSIEKGMIALGKGNENVILEVLADKKNEVSKFISSQNVRVKKEEDMIKIFAFYNAAVK